MGLFTKMFGKFMLKDALKYIDNFTAATSQQNAGSDYSHKRYAAYCHIGNLVAKKIKDDPETFAAKLVEMPIAPHAKDVVIYGVYLYYHDVIYSELRSGKHHIAFGQLDADGLGPHFLEIFNNFTGFALEVQLFPGQSREELTKFIRYAVENCSPNASDNRIDTYGCMIDLVHGI